MPLESLEKDEPRRLGEPGELGVTSSPIWFGFLVGARGLPPPCLPAPSPLAVASFPPSPSLQPPGALVWAAAETEEPSSRENEPSRESECCESLDGRRCGLRGHGQRSELSERPELSTGLDSPLEPLEALPSERMARVEMGPNGEGEVEGERLGCGTGGTRQAVRDRWAQSPTCAVGS